MSKRTLSHSPILTKIDYGGLTSIYRVPALILSREATPEYRLPIRLPTKMRKRPVVRQANATATLGRSHIATIHETDPTEGVTFVAIAWIREDEFRKVLQTERFSIRASAASGSYHPGRRADRNRRNHADAIGTKTKDRGTERRNHSSPKGTDDG